MGRAFWTRLGRAAVRRWWLWKRHEILVLKGLVNNVVMDDEVFLRLYEALHREGRITLTLREQYNLFRLAAQAVTLGGDIAEVGVFRGGSAKLICEVKGSARLHLFDTFEGMPEPDARVDLFRRGDFAGTSLAAVQDYLRAYEGVLYYPGLFPATAESAGIVGKFSLVHLDADIYESTLKGLRFFFPRLTTPGFILVHDFGSRVCPGVRRALEEFLAETPVPAVPLWDTHCLIVGAWRTATFTGTAPGRVNG
jgi:O-methyltransferase